MRSACLVATLGLAAAATDVSPPTISLNLVDGSPVTAGTTCEVQDATVTTCPLPVCSAHDHHDGALACKETFFLVNDNNVALGAPGTKFSGIKRDLRSLWLVTYDAVDNSGNEAETVSFTFRIEDTKPPILNTEFVKQISATVNGADEHRISSTQSPSACGAGCEKRAAAESCANGSASAPCTWTLPLDAKAQDNYDGDVASLIKLKLKQPNGVYSVGGASTWTLQSALAAGGLAIDTQQLGPWVLTYESCDKADMLGDNEQDNCWTQEVTVDVTDNTKPIITVTGGQTGSDGWTADASAGGGPGTIVANSAAVDVLECKVDTYVEQGATCVDLHDSWSPGVGFVSKAADVGGAVVNWEAIDGSKLKTTYTVKYDCADDLAQAADSKYRAVEVVDTRNPVINLLGAAVIENSQGAKKGKDAAWELDTGIHKELLNSQVQCTDECDDSPTIVRTLHYGGDCAGNLVGDGKVDNFPEYTTGSYSIKYVCTDGTAGDARARLTDSVCRKIINVDHMHPIIKVLGSDHMTLEATHEGNYIDDGATCSDQVDGVISQNVEVNGDVVNLSKPGIYNVEYNCQDAAGNVAPEAYRIVTVKQTSCPTCILNGCTNTFVETQDNPRNPKHVAGDWSFEGCSVKHEASFPYTDAGATCTDSIDGTITAVVTNPVDVETIGTYHVTYRAKNNVGTWNDDACRGLSVKYVRTVEVIDTLKPVIRLKYNGAEVARGETSDTGVHGQANGAYARGVAQLERHVGHGDFMAESAGAGADSWLLAAAASAVTGLALLSFSKRAAVSVAVPV